jgi:hypothetical protein
MGKRLGKKSSRSVHIIWNEEDINELLTWLDYCLIAGINFQSSVVAHLKSSRKKVYSWDQVTTKLRSVWNTYGVEGSRSSSVIFRQGTKCLPYLEDDTKEQILAGIKYLGPSSSEPIIQDHLRSSSRLTRSKRDASSAFTIASTTPGSVKLKRHRDSPNPPAHNQGKKITHSRKNRVWFWLFNISIFIMHFLIFGSATESVHY